VKWLKLGLTLREGSEVLGYGLKRPSQGEHLLGCERWSRHPVGDTFDNAGRELLRHLADGAARPGLLAIRQSLMTAIPSYIEGSYDRKRRHSTLGYLSPKDYETVSLNSKATTEPAESQMVAS
jgi:hypothetical protein